MDALKRVQDVYHRHTSRFFRKMVPFVTIVVGGSFFLKEFATLRYMFRRGKSLTEDEKRAMGVDKDLNAHLQEMMEKMDSKKLDDWQNVRGPRPWEDSKEMQAQQRAQFAAQAASQQS